MTLRELIKMLAHRDHGSDMPLMVVKDEDRSDWANVVGVEVHHDPIDDSDDNPTLIILVD